MFTPLSTGSEQAQDTQWDQTQTHTPTRPRVRASLSQITPPATVRANASGTLHHASGLRSGAVALGFGLGAAGAGGAGGAGGTSFASPFGPAPGVNSGPNSARQARIARKVSLAGNEDVGKHAFSRLLFRPARKTVDGWLQSFWKRHFVLVLVPCMAVWVWVAIPFPVSDPYSDSPFPDIPSWPKRPSDGGQGDLPLDVNFYFFLVWYFGMYLAVALSFITDLFSLYRLNWWPASLGGRLSYGLTWSTTLLVGLVAHHLDLFGIEQPNGSKDSDSQGFDWERKTFWVGLSFVAMFMPAVACFSKLKRDKRHTLRNPVPVVQRTFLGDHFSRRIPASWRRFLWFMTCLGIACFSLIAGQAYASLFLSTLPHTSLDAGTWVYSWVVTVQLLSAVSIFIISSKVRSRALLFIYKLFFQLVYHVFYRNLFARLRSPSQFITVQALSSLSVVVIFPLQMTRQWHQLLEIVIGYPTPYDEHVDNVATTFFCRGLAQNVTMVGFLGWLSILHFGPNAAVYPFFRLSSTPDDPYTFPLTFTASLAIWGCELVSSLIARGVMDFAFKVDVQQVGLDEMREYPELVPACGWASVHVSMNILMFLIKLNFR